MTEAEALDLDARTDPASQRHEFIIPREPGRHGEVEVAYFAGNSLGLQPRSARAAVEEVLSSWATRGVSGHHEGPHDWIGYADALKASTARVVGAQAAEVVVMNTLTVNLHMMLATFYRPTPARYRIIIEHDAFPSDRYAVTSQVALAGLDPDNAVVLAHPPEDIDELLDRYGDSTALVLLGAINYRTGALLDIEGITRAARARGCTVGWDLAHAAGNVELRMHDWDVDFAVWCSYKYLNSGPGAVGGCFVHARHGEPTGRPRPSGWWGNDPATRFRMADGFEPRRGADGWQVSNPPILAMAPVRASLELFDAVGMSALRARSLRLTGYLAALLDLVAANSPLRVITPRDTERRGAQLSIEVDDAAAVALALRDRHGVVCDERPPSIVRLAPVPLYSTFHDCWRAAVAVREVLGSR